MNKEIIKITGNEAVEQLNKLNNAIMGSITNVKYVLTETIKVGDWVKVEETEGEYTLFGKIKGIHRQGENKGYFDLEGAEEGYFLECHKITKLTDEQIKILGLE